MIVRFRVLKFTDDNGKTLRHPGNLAKLRKTLSSPTLRWCVAATLALSKIWQNWTDHYYDMFDIILFKPQIPPNTGNIIRLCANTGSRLHLIRPVGFDLDEKAVRRAGLDYQEMALVAEYDSLDECRSSLHQPEIFAVTKFAGQNYDQHTYGPNSAFLFGAETTGLPDSVHSMFADDRKIRLPMLAGNRSLNLSNAVSIVVYEAWRQCDFAGSVTLAPTLSGQPKDTE